jgi:hypothetical protein
MTNHWQYKTLKETARICLINYHATHAFFYLLRAIEHTALALAMRRLP